MHPDIKKFWDNQNRTNRQKGWSSSIFYTWYLRINNDPFAKIISHEWIDGSHIEYFFEGERYSEREMLKIIKMKAFI